YPPKTDYVASLTPAPSVTFSAGSAYAPRAATGTSWPGSVRGPCALRQGVFRRPTGVPGPGGPAPADPRLASALCSHVAIRTGRPGRRGGAPIPATPTGPRPALGGAGSGAERREKSRT